MLFFSTMPRALPSPAKNQDVIPLCLHRGQKVGNGKAREHSFILRSWPEVVDTLRLISLGQKLVTVFFGAKGLAEYSALKGESRY